jgi:hypothetical protein
VCPKTISFLIFIFKRPEYSKGKGFQLGRRNLTDDQRAIITDELIEKQLKEARELPKNKGGRPEKNSPHDEESLKSSILKSEGV